MRQVHIGLVVALLSTVGAGCKESTPGPGDTNTKVTAIMGHIADITGKAVSDVDVSGGGATAKSDASGKFTLSAKAAAQTLVKFSKSGFVLTQRRVDVQDGNATAIKIVMMPQAAAQKVDSTAGGAVTAARGAMVTIPAAAFVDAAGTAITGEVNVHLTAFDPSNEAELRAMPTLRAEQANGGAAELESFGVVDVTVRQNDKELQVKQGSELTVRIPPPSKAVAANLPATIPLWSYDEEKGQWKEEGTATYNAEANVYEGKVGHLSMWNCDQVITATCVKGLAKVDTGEVLPGAYVEAHGVDYNGVSSATSGSDGKFCMAVRQTSKLRITTTHPNGGGTSREVKSEGTPTSVPPNCGDPKCLDVGEWVVKAGSFTDTGGNTSDCANVQNPMAGTCADGLWDLVTCWNPSGKCTIKTSGGISWENGASLEVTSTGTGTGSSDVKYIGPGNTQCGTAKTSYDTATSASTTVITLASGPSFTIKQTGTDKQSVVCPDGTTVEIDPVKTEAFRSCTQGMSSGTGASQCGFEDGYPGTCKSDTDCTLTGQKCCPMSGTTSNFCQYAEGGTCPTS